MASVYFDSSVFLAIFKGEPAADGVKGLLRELKKDRVRILTSILTIQEVSVHGFKAGAEEQDQYTRVNKLARVESITKEIAVTAAQFEAHLLAQFKREPNHQ